MAGTITHQWNGTVLTITSDSGTSSCDLKGAKGDDGPRGPQGVQGERGETGVGEQGLKGEPFTYDDFTPEQLAALTGPEGPAGASFTYDMFTEAQLEALRGPQGPQGPAGPQGEAGSNGVGVPVGGSTGQVLTKVSAADYDVNWTDLYPIGAIYLSVLETNPATLFGGTWEILNDVFLLAAGSYADAGTFGGEASHTLTMDEMPAHNHSIPNMPGYDTGTAWVGQNGTAASQTRSTAINGGGAAHNNMPPYLAVYMWKRVA